MSDKLQDMLAADLRQLASDNGERYELIEGELITMAPAGNQHGAIASTLGGEIYLYLKQNPLGKGLAAETGFLTRGDSRTVRAPDYAFIPHDRIPKDGLPDGFSQIVPALVAEVVSPHDSADYVERKIHEWLAFGVGLVWVIYPKTQHVHVYHGESATHRLLTAEDTLDGEDILPNFRLPVRVIFD